MRQQGLSPQTWRVWASEILLTNKTPLTKTNSQFSTPPNKLTKLSITRRKLVNRGKTLGVSCFWLLPPASANSCGPSGRRRAGPRPPGVCASWRKTCPPGLQHKDSPVKGLSQVLSGTTGQMQTRSTTPYTLGAPSDGMGTGGHDTQAGSGIKRAQ